MISLWLRYSWKHTNTHKYKVPITLVRIQRKKWSTFKAEKLRGGTFTSNSGNKWKFQLKHAHKWNENARNTLFTNKFWNRIEIELCTRHCFAYIQIVVLISNECILDGFWLCVVLRHVEMWFWSGFFLMLCLKYAWNENTADKNEHNPYIDEWAERNSKSSLYVYWILQYTTKQTSSDFVLSSTATQQQ